MTDEDRIQVKCPTLEALLDYSSYLNYDGSDFPLKTDYTISQKNYADKLFQDNYIFEGVGDLSEAKRWKGSAERRAEGVAGTREWWKFYEKKTLTYEEKNDLIMLKLRSFIDTKIFYKKSDFKKLPKFFYIGTVVDDGVGGDVSKAARIPRGKRASTLTELFLKDDAERKFSRRKFLEIYSQKKKKERFRVAGNKMKKLKRMTKRINKKGQK